MQHLSVFKMQELEQRVLEADQRAENAEKQVVELLFSCTLHNKKFS